MEIRSFSCGLFGITDDYADISLSLDEKFLGNKNSTFFVKAAGDSMLPEIKPKDILVVDRSLDPVSGSILTFFLNEKALCKQFIKEGKNLKLRSFNPKYEDYVIQETDDFQIFGVVIGLARDLI